MTRTALLARAAALLLALPAASAAPGPQGSRPWVVYGGRGEDAPRVVLVSGDEEYRSEEALPMLGRLLSDRHGMHCTVLFAIDPETGEIDPDEQTNVPGLHLVDDADLVVLFVRFRELPASDMRHLVAYVESGKPVIGIRTATHAFAYTRDPEDPFAHWDWRSESWPGGFGRQVLGETWVAHHGAHGSQSTRGVPVADGHPILRGVEDVWGPTDVYAVGELPGDAVVLLEGSVRAGMTPDAPAVEGPKNDPRMPIAWCRERDPDGTRGRVVCSTIGAAQDLDSEDLRRFLVNASFWCLGREESIPAEGCDARLAAPFRPTPFGFGDFVRGRRPADHAR